jgi:hypothetical protein
VHAPVGAPEPLPEVGRPAVPGQRHRVVGVRGVDPARGEEIVHGAPRRHVEVAREDARVPTRQRLQTKQRKQTVRRTSSGSDRNALELD